MPTKFCCLPILLLLCQLALAVDKDASELELTTQKVIVFKDGYALIIKKATATSDKAGEVFTDDVPDAAVLGSFWAVPDEGRMVSMLAGWKSTTDTDEKQLPCTQTIEILLANKGKQAKVELHDKTLYNGVIQEVLVDKTAAPLAPAMFDLLDLANDAAKPKALISSSASRLVQTPANTEHTLTAFSGSNFILRTEEGDVLLPVGQVRSIMAKEMKTTLAKDLTTSKKAKRLSFKFEGAAKKQSMTLMYFRPGIRWIPTYRVSLTDKKDAAKEAAKKMADISLQAELLNEAEDLEDVPVDIVVGVPNFRFRGVPSPLVLEATLRNALAESAPDIMGNSSQLSNALYTRRAGEFRRNQANAGAQDGVVVNLPGELTGGGAQDLFVYNLPKISQGKGDRIAVPIFTTKSPYQDIYTWDVHITKQDNGAAPGGSGVNSPLVLSKNEVWHQIILTNNTNVPWTTGAAMIMQGNQPLAQELLTYSPPKDEVRVPVTVSVDTRGSLDEKEISRELKSIQWEGYQYARIERELKLDLCNNKPIEIDVEITLRVGGKVTKATHDGKITLSGYNAADWTHYQGHPAVNNSSTVIFKGKLKPGDKLEPVVTYHYYTRH